jgi:WD40 repeat protein
VTWRRMTIAACLGLVLAAGAAAGLPRVAHELPEPLGNVARLPERLWTRFFPPRVSKNVRLADLTGPEREAVDALAKRLDGLIVWSSNRSGNHELYLLDLHERAVRRLTHDPYVHFFGRISPDGARVVFLRSQREWVSARDPTTLWDIYLVNVDGTGERRLVESGFHPTWTADGRGIVFFRGNRVFRYDVGTGRESLLLDVEKALPGIEEFGDVELSPDGSRFAFPLRGRFSGLFGLSGGFSGAAVYNPAGPSLALLTREQACQTTWAPDGQSLLWVETGGNGGTRIMTGRPDGSGRSVFMDLPGERSHEYFPKLSNDGHWLVWGAAAEGHEHDRADYDIFVWQVGTPASDAVRLTHHPGNDNWPDLWVRPGR